jgi:hypothetical protein
MEKPGSLPEYWCILCRVLVYCVLYAAARYGCASWFYAAWVNMAIANR